MRIAGRAATDEGTLEGGGLLEWSLRWSTRIGRRDLRAPMIKRPAETPSGVAETGSGPNGLVGGESLVE